MSKQNEENIALLAYMIHHNEHHMDELKELADATDDPCASLIREAIADFISGNKKLQAAFENIRGGEA